MIYLIFALLSYPVSVGIDYLTLRSMLMDAGSEGYKANLDYFEENKDNNTFIKYIPLVNLAKSLSSNLDYNFNRVERFNTLRVFGAFLKMNKEEEEYYKEKPGFVRAMNIAVKSKECTDKLLECYQSVNDIVKLDGNLEEHDIILVDRDKEKIVNIDKVIDALSKEELEELKYNLTLINDWDKFFPEDDRENKDEYVITSSKGKTLKYRFNKK